MPKPDDRAHDRLTDEADLRARLAEAEETLRAIRNNEVDALVVSTPAGEQVYTLKSAEQPYRVFLEKMQEGAITVALDGTILYSNQRFADMVKCPLERVMGSPIRRFVDLAEQAAWSALLKRGTNRPGHGEFTLQDTNGQTIPVYLSANPSPVDEVAGVCVVITDLTEQKRGEAIVAAERLARSILENAAEAIVVCDESGRVIRASHAARQLCGEDPLLKPFNAMFPLTRRCEEGSSTPRTSSDEDDAYLRGILQGQAIKGAEFCFRRADGKQRQVLLSAGPLREQRRLIGTVITLTDVTQLKQAQAALAESELRFRSMAETVPDILFTARPDGSWEYANQRFYERTGLAPGAAEGFGWASALHPEDAPRVRAWWASPHGVGPAMIEYRLRTADGGYHWFVARMQPVRDAEGAVVRWFGAASDIHELKTAQETLQHLNEVLEQRVAERSAELQRSLDQLRQSERLASMGTLATGLAHEINNPLNSIVLVSEYAMSLPENLSDPVQVRAALNTIIGEAKRCGKIVKSILQFARQSESERTPQDPNGIVEHAVTLASSYVGGSQVTYDLQLAPGLALVRVNATEIEQVIINLIQNAAQAAGKAVQVSIRTEQARGDVRLIVRDNGPGIPADHLKHLFDPFFTTRRERGGTGLGLSIAHGILAKHGGRIEAASQPGAGATFTIHLPAIKE